MNLTLNQLFKCNAYLGGNRRNWNSHMNLFIVGHKYDIYFINLKYTLFLFKKVLNILNKNSRSNILILVPEQLRNILNVTIDPDEVRFISNIQILTKWSHGYLSNYKMYIEHFKKRILPRFLFLCPNLFINMKYYSILNEIKKYNMVSMGFINSSDNPYILDYFIPINNNSVELIKFYFRIILFYIYLLNLKKVNTFFKKIIKNLISKKVKNI